MAWNYYDAGIGNVGSYQASGHPWVTSSVLQAGEERRITFPYVTKAVTVAQSGSGVVRVHFVSKTAMSGSPGGSGCFWTISSGSLGDRDAITMNVKCKEIYVSNGESANTTGFQMFAELTRIETNRMWALTGSGISFGGHLWEG
jgi:hypothetical protein